MVRLLFVLQSALSLWMLTDAIRRKRDRYWFMVIMLPFGEVAYFFMVKIHDPEMARFKNFFKFNFNAGSSRSLRDLRFAAEQTPSLQNNVTLGQALHDAGDFAESVRWFNKALAQDSGSKAALHGIGLCHLELAMPANAIEPLQRVIEIEPGYREWTLWSDLGSALWQCDRHDEALKLMKRLVDERAWLPHRMHYAYYLDLSDESDEARHQIETGLAEYENAPAFQRKRDRAVAKEARRLLADHERLRKNRATRPGKPN